MTDLVELIHSDSAGRPNLWGGRWHFVRWSSNPNMHTVAQMRAGGRYPGMDCFPADALSRLLDDGRDPAMASLEVEGGTNLTFGTSIPGAERILTDNRYVWHYIPKGAVPPGLFGMNPAMGIIIPPSGRAPYAAASTGQLIVIDTPG